MGFPLGMILKWVLPAIPEVLSAVRNFKTQQRQPAAPSLEEDQLGRIEKLEKALELQSHINEALTLQLQQLQKRLQILTFVALCGLILAAVVLVLLIF